MGLAYISAKLFRTPSKRKQRVRFLVDSGAVYTVLPRKIWRGLSLVPSREVEFSLADGTVITRSVSECTFEVQGKIGTSPVVLGEEADAPLLGMVTLEVLGLMINPLSRELLPMRMVLANIR
ncbi:MAG: retroviral-like aspartic protease family protein [Deltaproteobacteria bacterium]|nr:retroviral-like aspartic protease family protein [Deltaproteobacteria bacterium]